uniref:Cathepsin propeptide inhibitor domain-containing protein n=1 Tax=Salmo trutta TaxID=8032 RepID=A0A674F6Q9_SALTR
PRPEEEEVDKEFEMWKTHNGKTYNSTEEEAKRKEIWLATRARVMEHNKRAETGLESFTMGMNHLSDRGRVTHLLQCTSLIRLMNI